jgi:hypothetical protein
VDVRVLPVMSLCLLEASSHSPITELIVGVYNILDRSSNWAVVFWSLTNIARSDHSAQSYAWAILNVHAPEHMSCVVL